MALTQAQITQYYATEGKKANPLSPTAWLAQQTAPSSTQSPVNAPQSTITQKTTSNLSQSQLDAIEAQISGIRNQTQAIATQIPAATLKTPAEITLPKAPTPDTSYSGITAGATSSIDAYIKNMNDLMASYTANAPKPTDMSSIYDQLSSELGIDNQQVIANQKQAAVNTATAELNNIQAQIQAINDEEKAAQLQLEKNAATGSDITSAFLGRQQQEISRNSAIKALPLQSQALVASAKVSAAQGDQQLAQNQLEQAEEKLNTVFKIRSDYETQKYEYNQNLIGKVFEFASDTQKVLLQARQQEESRAYQQYQDTLSIQQSIAKEAMAEGDYNTASKITGLDPKSPTYGADLARLQAGITAGTKANTASIQEYEYAKQQGYTGSYIDYQNEDANRKVSIAKAGVGGLSSAEAGQVNGLSSKFSNEAIVKNFNILAEGYDFANSIANNTQNPADQQGLIYAFAKAMDPGSVVREGEYATVQRYAQSWADNFGFDVKRIYSNSPFLTEKAMANMKATIKTKYEAAKKNYDNVYSEYSRKINKITGSGGEDYLVSYSSAYPEINGATNTGTPQPSAADEAYLDTL